MPSSPPYTTPPPGFSRRPGSVTRLKRYWAMFWLVPLAALAFAAYSVGAALGHRVPDATTPLLAAPPPPDPKLLAQQRLAGLQAVLTEEAGLIDGRVSVHVRFEDGAEAGIEPERAVDAASVIKVAVMAALYQAWESGAVKRTPQQERWLRLMITRSRNTETNYLIQLLGKKRINLCLEKNGYSCCCLRTRILKDDGEGPNLVSAAEMTRMLQQITHGELVSKNASAEMRKLLLAQHWRERIPGRLPKGVVVGNKTGTMSNLLHDVAFIEAPGGLRYYLAVFIERQDRSHARSEEIARLSRHVYDYLTGAPTLPASATPLTPPA